MVGADPSNGSVDVGVKGGGGSLVLERKSDAEGKE